MQPSSLDPPPEEPGTASTLALQVTCVAAWQWALPGQPASDIPLAAVAIAVGRPNLAAPPDRNGDPPLALQVSGFRSCAGADGANGSLELARWTRDTASDVIRFTLPTTPEAADGWQPDEVLVVKTLSYNAHDPRLDLSTGGPVLVTRERVRGSVIVVDEQPVQCLAVSFALDRPFPNAAVTLAVDVTFGGTARTLHCPATSREPVLWELISDRYAAVDTLKYAVRVTVVGPGLDDEPVAYASDDPIAVDLPRGPCRRLAAVTLALPDVPWDQAARVDDYIARFRA